MKLSDITVEVRDRTLTKKGMILPKDLNLRAEILFNNVGSWTLLLPVEHPLATVLRTPGSGIVVTGPQGELFSGPTIGPSFDASSEDPAGTVTIEGVTDEIVLSDMLAFPEPGNIDPTKQKLANDTRTGPAEDVIHGFVNANIGPGAPAARRKAALVMGANLHRGATITKSARFDNLGTLITDTALVAKLGFRVIQRGSQLVFETYQIVDRSKLIRLDIWNNTLAKQTVVVSPPSATQVIIAGQGDLTERTFYAATNATATQAETDWGRRIERFIDQRHTNDVNEYIQASNEVLAAEGATTVIVKATPMDDNTMRFGYDWNVGDLVSTVIDSSEFPAPVSSVALAADSEGFRLNVALGDVTQLTDARAARALALSTANRVGSLERNTGGGPAVPPGVTMAFAGTTAPTGYLKCDGSSVLRTDYANLFAVIGTKYGAVDATHFTLPTTTGSIIKV